MNTTKSTLQVLVAVLSLSYATSRAADFNASLLDPM